MAAPSTVPHATLPECPNCEEAERAVADLHSLRWHCFSCGANGGVMLLIDGEGPGETPPEPPPLP